MNIKFSRKYDKLSDNLGGWLRESMLIAVQEINLEEMSEAFLGYDTDNGSYKLPKKGAYLMLIFLKPDGCNLFTTLRRLTPEKFNYYHDAIGQVFNIEIQDGIVDKNNLK